MILVIHGQVDLTKNNVICLFSLLSKFVEPMLLDVDLTLLENDNVVVERRIQHLKYRGLVFSSQ